MRKIVAFGLAGAIAVGSVSASASLSTAAPVTSAHVAWCQQNYRSYNPATDSFIGNDGNAHRCISPDATGSQTLSFVSPTPLITASPTQQNPPGNRYNVFPSENDPNYGQNQN